MILFFTKLKARVGKEMLFIHRTGRVQAAGSQLYHLPLPQADTSLSFCLSCLSDVPAADDHTETPQPQASLCVLRKAEMWGSPTVKSRRRRSADWTQQIRR